MTDPLKQFICKAKQQLFSNSVALAMKHHAPKLSDDDARKAAQDVMLYGTGVVWLEDDGTARHVPYHEYVRRKK